MSHEGRPVVELSARERSKSLNVKFIINVVNVHLDSAGLTMQCRAALDIGYIAAHGDCRRRVGAHQ